VIARVWSARAEESRLAAYLDYFRARVLPELRRVKGFSGVTVFTRPAPNSKGAPLECEIVVTTQWRSLEAIARFAGADLEAAVVAPEAAALLLSFDRRVRHYDLALWEPAPGSSQRPSKG
jgi:heme-degrading monooxygenase HmoA